MTQQQRLWRVFRRSGSILLCLLLLICILTSLAVTVVLPLVDLTPTTDGRDLVLVPEDGSRHRIAALGLLVALMSSWWGALVVLGLAVALIALWWWPRWSTGRPRGWPATVRRHVLTMTALPVIVVLFAGGYLTVIALDDLEQARDTARAAQALPALVTATRTIQAESSALDKSIDLTAVQADSDAALIALQQAVDPMPLDSSAGASLRAVSAVQQQVAAARDTAATDQSIARQDYTAVVSALDDLAATWASAIADPAMAASARAVVATDQLAGDLEQEADSVAELFAALDSIASTTETTTDTDADADTAATTPSESAISSGLATATQTEPVETVELDAAQVRQAALTVAGTDAQRAHTAAVLATLNSDSVALPSQDRTLEDARAVIAAGEPTLVSEAARTSWADRASAQAESIRAVSTAAIDTLDTQTADAQDQARSAAVGVLAVAVLALVLTGLISAAVIRRLRALTPEEERHTKTPVEAAPPVQDTSTPALPLPTRRTTATALEPAAAPPAAGTEMLIHIAQREQALAARQLVLLDELERSEVDPDVLSRLFELDNLATRTRRGAESVLVLAGSQTGRRERDSAALSDVVRIASAQIEQYDRVQLDLTVDPELAGHAVVVVAHLLAELLENGTVHSDPLLPVRVSAVQGAQGIEIRITDSGLGMSEEERAHAQALVHSESMPQGHQFGLVVVGRLARLIDAQVSFPPTGQGTTVQVDLPQSLVVPASVAPSAMHTAPADALPLPTPSALDSASAQPEPLTMPAPSVFDSISSRLDPPQSMVVPAPLATEPTSVPVAVADDAAPWTPAVQFTEDPSTLTYRRPVAAPEAPAAGEAEGEYVPIPLLHDVSSLAGRPQADAGMRDPGELRERLQRFRHGVQDGHSGTQSPGITSSDGTGLDSDGPHGENDLAKQEEQ